MRASFSSFSPILLLILIATGCPAEGPIDDEPTDDASNGSTEDAGNDDDGGEEAGLQLESVSPASGSLSGGTTVRLTGTGFDDGLTVRFGSKEASEITLVDEFEADVVTPSGDAAGTVTVTISNAQGDSDSLLNAFRYEDDPQGSIEFCMLQAQSPVEANVGVASPTIYAVVFAEGVTQGAGQGSGLEGELGWGSGTDPAAFEYSSMTFNVDKDGINPGDLANDEYGGAVIADEIGTFRYAARFRRTGDDVWTYCDLDGNENGIDADQLGVLEVVESVAPQVQDCRLQFPQVVVDGRVGTATSIYGRVRVDGITGSGSANDVVQAELLVGPADKNPAADTTEFDVVPASYNAETIGLEQGWDEHVAEYLPTAAGEYAFAYRFRAADEAEWTYCDFDGSAMFEEDRIGYLAVTDGDPHVVDYCHVWETTLDVAAADPAPTVTVEVYEDPTTVANGGANSAEFTVEAGYGYSGTNPALPGAFTWSALTYKDLRPGEPNNYEYDGSAYGSAPLPGSYVVFARVKHADDTFWTYCDTDENTPAFALGAATSLTVR